MLIPVAFAQDFKGQFELDKPQIYLGEEFTLTGEISYQGTPLDSGVVIVRLKYQNMVVPFAASLDNGVITATGTLTFTPEGEPMPAGAYNVDVIVYSIYGDYTFEDVAMLNIDNQLVTTAELDKDNILPGDSITISGTVEKLGGERVDGTLRITVDNDTTSNSTFRNGIFSYKIKTFETINSYEHKIKVYVIDNSGNHHTRERTFYVTPVPTLLDLVLEKTSFLPEDTILIIPILYDQANDTLDKEVDIRIIDSKGKVELEQNSYTESALSYLLPKFAVPGTWKIKAISEGVEKETEFLVGEVKELDVSLSGQTLVVRNVGNVDYNDYLKIIVTGDESKTIERRTYLGPGESFSVPLYEDLKDGDYRISVLGEVFDVTVKDPRSAVDKATDFLGGITGSVVAARGSSTSRTPFYVFLVVMISLIIFVGRYKFEQSKYSKRAREREMERAKKRKERLKKLNKLKPRRLFGRPSKSDISDFKARILRDIERDKARRSYREQVNVRLGKNPQIQETKEEGYVDLTKSQDKKNEDNSGRGLFNMFD